MKHETKLTPAELWKALEMRTDAQSQSPLYQQIYLVIRDRILSGEYPDQSLLPSENELAKLFGVSRITTKRALNEISAEGLCDRKRGTGSRVTYKPATAPLKTDVQGLLDYLFQMNLATQGFVLKFDYVAASAEIATVMKIETGAEIQRSVRVRHLDGTPFSYLTTYVPGDLGRLYTREHISSQAVLTVLEKTGVEVAHAEQTITATLAGARAAESLQVKLSSPLLRISRIVFDRNERVVEHIVGLYRPDQYQYRTLLSRVSTGNETTWSESK
jgi:GntR family transcriptional regulator